MGCAKTGNLALFSPHRQASAHLGPVSLFSRSPLVQLAVSSASAGNSTSTGCTRRPAGEGMLGAVVAARWRNTECQDIQIYGRIHI
jgi:hypothetical protein